MATNVTPHSSTMTRWHPLGCRPHLKMTQDYFDQVSWPVLQWFMIKAGLVRGCLVLSTTTTMSNNQLRQCQCNVSYEPSISGDNSKSQSDSSRASNSVQESSRPAKRRVTNDHSASPLEQQSEPSQAQASSFHPIVPKSPPHHAFNTLPPTIRHLDAIEPKNILDLFLTTSLLKTMTTNTNSYAAIKRVEKEPSEDPTTGRAWKEVTPDELAAWIGIVVYMGVHSSPATRDTGSTMSSTQPTLSATT